MFLPKSGIWTILCQLMAILAKCFEIWTSNLLCPEFTLTLINKPSFKSIRPKSAIISPNKLQKLTKVAISQNPILPKCHSPKSILLLHFSMNLSETFRINVNMDFAHTNHGRFLNKAIFWILGTNSFGGLIQKSIFTLILYVSDKFIEKCRRSRIFGEWHLGNGQIGVLRYGHFGEFLEFICG